MRTRFLVSLIVGLCVLIGVGPAAASEVNYLDGSSSLAIDLGNGLAFVFFNDLVPPDIFIHAVDFFADLLPVSLNNTFNGSAFHLRFEGFNQGFTQYGVYTCNTSNLVSCNVSSTRLDTFFLE